MTQLKHHFGPAAVGELSKIAREIADEKAAAGVHINEQAREFIAACVVSCAANGVTDPEAIKREALSHAA
jgi:hypothetical protein